MDETKEWPDFILKHCHSDHVYCSYLIDQSVKTNVGALKPFYLLRPIKYEIDSSNPIDIQKFNDFLDPEYRSDIYQTVEEIETHQLKELPNEDFEYVSMADHESKMNRVLKALRSKVI